MQRISIKLIFSIFLTFCLFFISGCATKYGREFISDESSKKVEVDGWSFIPEIYAFKNIVYNEEPTNDKYFISLGLESPEIEKDTIMGVILIPKIAFFNFRDIKDEFNVIHNVLSEYLLSYCSFDYFDFEFVCKGEYDPKVIYPPPDERLYIPREIDTLLMEFTIQFVKAKHKCFEDYGVLTDSFIIVEPLTVEKEELVTLKLIRKESKTKIPFFMVEKF